jgi:hypothetical protein
MILEVAIAKASNHRRFSLQRVGELYTLIDCMGVIPGKRQSRKMLYRNI